ncbi:MAG TPA: V-type ATP synthase subunit E [Candidatus Acidoferrales bacterium]|nr:V-type ATP synthase subunit E [Candidatus Acidoferrales bacterium]
MTGLEVVQKHQLAATHAQADAILGDARTQAQQIMAKAKADAHDLIDHAEKEGDMAAELDTSREWTTARRRARGIILAAQSAVYDELRAAVSAAIRSDPRYPSLLHELADSAHRHLGPGAEVSVDTGGTRVVTASSKHRHVDWSLDSIAKESLDRLGTGIEELWR